MLNMGGLNHIFAFSIFNSVLPYKINIKYYSLTAKNQSDFVQIIKTDIPTPSITIWFKTTICYAWDFFQMKISPHR